VRSKFDPIQHLLETVPSDIASLEEILKAELAGSEAYQAAWAEGTRIFEERRETLVDPEDKDIPDEYHIALIAYTCHDTPADWPFYSQFNGATRDLRTEADVSRYPYKSFFQFLYLGIIRLNPKPKFQPPIETELYRGLSIRQEFDLYSWITFQQFTSLTRSREVAETYAEGMTLFVFEPVTLTSTGINMHLHSKFPGEEEILVTPTQVYQVNGQTSDPGGLDIFTLRPLTVDKFKLGCNKDWTIIC